MFDGKPVDRAIVNFVPDQGNGRTVTARCDDKGRYYTDAVSGIAYRVEIFADRLVGREKDAIGIEHDLYESVVPPRYGDRVTSRLSVTAAEGKRTVADFSLSSQP